MVGMERRHLSWQRGPHEVVIEEPITVFGVDEVGRRPYVVGWNIWTPFQGIQPAEGGIEPIKSLIRQLANPPERMAGRDSLFDRDVGEQGATALLLASHQPVGS
jgi:hypothetical protein